MLDFHNHLIPSVDDGAASIDESTYGLSVMSEQGIGNIITTPHLRASLIAQPDAREAYFDKVDRGWETLCATRRTAFPNVNLNRGFEILLDTPWSDFGEPKLRLAGTQFVLVEFGFDSLPPRSADVLFEIKIAGWRPIVAHPERYRDVQFKPNLVEQWVHVGAHLQANAGSFVGAYGVAAERTAWKLLESGAISYVCSDFHAVGNCHTTAAIEAIADRFGRQLTHQLFSENSETILSNAVPKRVQPIPRRRGWFRKWRRSQ